MSRFWYLSLTIRWHEAEGFSQLQNAVKRLIKSNPLPYHHLLVPKKSWHSTVFAIAQVKHFPDQERAAADYMQSLFDELTQNSGLIPDIEKIFSPIWAWPKKLRCFNNNTTIQFADIDALSGMRDELRKRFLHCVNQLCASRRHVRPLIEDKYKSSGKRLYGSLARSPDSGDDSQLCWEVEFPPFLPPLVFQHAWLLVSDDALTNVLTNGNCRRVTMSN